jgi:rhodanese-related sulfurtransferase
MKIILTLLILLSIILTNLSANKISNTEALRMQQNGALIVDIRTKFEYDTLHVTGSVNVPAHKIVKGKRVPRVMFMKEIYKLHKQRTIIIICRTGSRTLHLTKILQKKNINVACVRHGFDSNSFEDDWVDLHLPVQGTDIDEIDDGDCN